MTGRVYQRPVQSKKGEPPIDMLAGFTDPDALGAYYGPDTRYGKDMQKRLAKLESVQAVVADAKTRDDPAAGLFGFDEDDRRLGKPQAIKDKIRSCVNAVGMGHAERWDADPVYRRFQRLSAIPRVLMYKRTDDWIAVPELRYLEGVPNDLYAEEAEDIADRMKAATWDEDKWLTLVHARGSHALDPDAMPKSEPRKRPRPVSWTGPRRYKGKSFRASSDADDQSVYRPADSVGDSAGSGPATDQTAPPYDYGDVAFHEHPVEEVVSGSYFTGEYEVLD